MSKVLTDQIEKRTGGTAIDLPATGKWPEAAIADDAVTLAKMAGLVRGKLIVGDASGDPSALTVGTADQVLTSDGTDAAWSTLNTGTSWQAVKTAAFTAVAGNGYPVNTTSSTITVTLPASASVGDTIEFTDYAGTWNSNEMTLDPGSLKIRGTTTSYAIATQYGGIRLVYIDATQGWGAPTSATGTVLSSAFTATGGTKTTHGLYTVHTFTASGNFVVTGVSGDIDIFAVGGGGGGGGMNTGSSYNGAGAGGGAGGFRTLAISNISAATYAVVVGAGGAGGVGSGSPGGGGTNGGDSSFDTSTLTSAGGGGGAAGNDNGVPSQAGGSGGGGSREYTPAGAGNTPSTTPSQGFPGGTGGAGNSASSGGGGAGAAGVDGQSNGLGTGGAGENNDYKTGSNITYAGGGGGGRGGSGGTGAAGGSGGGGAGGVGEAGAGGAGTVNLGAGGGGGAATTSSSTSPSTGGAGGSGIVIVRYLT